MWVKQSSYFLLFFTLFRELSNHAVHQHHVILYIDQTCSFIFTYYYI